MKKTLAATAIAASTLGGVAAGAALFVPGSAGAQEGADETGETAGREFGAHIAEALQPLVDDGTLTESQVDAVTGALEAARPEGPRDGGRGHGNFGRRGPAGGGEIAEILGLEPQELGEALRGGQSLADVAAEQGVDTQDLIDALVANAEERAADAVEAGRIDQEKADEIIAGAAEHAEGVVSGEFQPGRRGPGRGGRGGPGFGPGADGGPDTDTSA